MNKKSLVTLLKYGLGLVLLGWVVWNYWEPASGPGIKAALQRDIQWGPFALACSICSLALMLTFVRWWILVRAQELPFSLFQALRLGFVGFYLSTFLPGSVGGDILKAAFIARDQKRRTVAVATVVVDRILGLVGLVWLVAILGTGFSLTGALTGQQNLQYVVLTAASISLATTVFWFFLGFFSSQRAERLAQKLDKFPKIGHSLAEAWRACWIYRQRGRSVVLALAMSLLGHVGFVLTYYFAALSLFAPTEIPSLEVHFLIIPIGMTVSAIPLTPGGLGVGEVAFGMLYLQMGYPEANGVFMSFVQRLICWMLGLLSYIAYLWMKPASKEVPKEKLAAAV